MISISISLFNPFAGRNGLISLSKPTKSKSFRLTKNKAIELELSRPNVLIGFSFLFTIRTDHAGLRLGLMLLNHEFEFSFYDVRHWNDDTEMWESYEDGTSK